MLKYYQWNHVRKSSNEKKSKEGNGAEKWIGKSNYYEWRLGILRDWETSEVDYVYYFKYWKSRKFEEDYSAKLKNAIHSILSNSNRNIDSEF